jgi:hypothetical protein
MCAGARMDWTILRKFGILARSIAKLHFLVEEGQIRAEAIVRHVKPGCGLGMEFRAVLEEDRQRLAGLMKRLREFGWISKFQSGEHGQQAHPS